MNYQKNFTLSFIVVCFTACNSEPPQKELPFVDLTIPEKFEGFAVGGYITPTGTTAKVKRTGNRSVMTFEFRDGLIRVGRNVNGDVVAQFGGTYTCTSNCGWGCDVVNFGGDVGCSSCKDEKGKITTGTCTGTHSEDDSERLIYDDSGFIDLNKGISIILNSEEMDDENFISIPTWKVMSQIPEVSSELTRFMTAMWGETEITTSNSKSAVVNFFGAKAVLSIPADAIVNGRISSGTPSCSCDSGSSGCTLEEIRKFGVKVGYMCVRGGCTSCTMENPEL